MTDESQRIERDEGRQLFGSNPACYALARPEYPERVYEILQDRCGLRAGSRVLEIGPGTGQVTKRLIELRAGTIVAIEPDERLASYLAQGTREAGGRVEVLVTAFEDVHLEAELFDVAIAASSFHWVDQRHGLEKVARALCPGGWWAMWWTVFGDASRPDPFRVATNRLLRRLPPGPSAGGDSGSPFALDVEARRADLVATDRFRGIESEVLPWAARMSTDEVRALYATFSSISRLADDEQRRLLDEIAGVADNEFGGDVERPFVTVIYTAQRKLPDHPNR